MRLAGCCLLITGIFGTLLLGFGYFLIDRNSNMTIALPALLIAIAFGALLVFRPETPADSVVIEGEESDKAAAQDSLPKRMRTTARLWPASSATRMRWKLCPRFQMRPTWRN